MSPDRDDPLDELNPSPCTGTAGGGSVVPRHSAAHNSVSEYLTTQQVAERLQVSVDTVRRLFATGLPIYRFGRAVRVRLADLAQWEEQHRHGSVPARNRHLPDRLHVSRPGDGPVTSIPGIEWHKKQT